MNIAAYPKYDSYQEVKISWCEELPSHWTTQPIRNLFTESRRKNGDGKNKDYLSLMANRGIIPYSEKGDVGNKMPADLSGCKLVDVDDFVLNSMNFGIGSFGVSSLKGVCSSVYVILKANNPASIKYYERIFQHPQFQTFSQSLGNGILAHRCAIGWDELKNAHFPVPPVEEIQAIAAFLDGKCATIDEAVRIKDEQIRLLAERRQILIQEAVTRGLNPDAPMKDSGIDWIGQIPAHWEVKRLKDVSRSVKTGRTPSSSSVMDYFEGGTIPWYTPGDVQDGGVFGASEKRLSPSAISHGHVDLFPENCIFFIGIGGTLGKANISRVPASCNQQFNVIAPNKDIVPDWLLVWLNVSRDVVFNQTDYTTMPIMNQSKTKRIPLPVPPLGEQEEILGTLRDRRAKINAAIALKKSQITALREYKASLINAAVTGKIKVL
ncbi:restriction endonuclease subunit S [Parasaccharibacter sp. TMW2.1890]|uniref:restriction endonuclease subunit S n=1 Tax=Parasaccharibacter sp. TMW2.1890 TaxID=2039289 RepID=UPI002010E936|nr:restriction endonuclease subunit S [Parasaccharibacter sp. TMW2.1890]MCL1514847.1 hypothetical protein [Parasaccharibacter sp. TMW2.1890]